MGVAQPLTGPYPSTAMRGISQDLYPQACFHLFVDYDGVGQNLCGVGKQVLVDGAVGALVRLDHHGILGRAVETVAAVVRVPL